MLKLALQNTHIINAIYELKKELDITPVLTDSEMASEEFKID